MQLRALQCALPILCNFRLLFAGGWRSSRQGALTERLLTAPPGQRHAFLEPYMQTLDCTVAWGLKTLFDCSHGDMKTV